MAKEITLDGVKYREVVEDANPTELDPGKFSFEWDSVNMVVKYDNSMILAFTNDGLLMRLSLSDKDKLVFQSDETGRIRLFDYAT